MQPIKHDTPDTLLKIAEAADRLGISQRKLWRLLAIGAIAAVRVGARGTRIKSAVLTQYLASLPTAR